jgi:hypothetical protein
VALAPGIYTAQEANWAARERPVSRRRGVSITDRPNDPAAGVAIVTTAAVSRSTIQKEEQTMTIYRYQCLVKAIQDDALRAGERERLLLEARRARRARRQRLAPAVPARRRTGMGKIVVSENATLDTVIQDPAGRVRDPPPSRLEQLDRALPPA